MGFCCCLSDNTSQTDSHLQYRKWSECSYYSQPELWISQCDQLLQVNINLHFLFFISLCHNHVIMPVFSESLVNSKNKYSSCDLIRDFTVETASTSRHI